MDSSPFEEIFFRFYQEMLKMKKAFRFPGKPFCIKPKEGSA